MAPSSKHLGAKNELIACVWLINEGYEVYRNVSQHGAIDLIAVKDSKHIYLDVKTAYKNKNGDVVSARLNQAQVDSGVLPLYVFDDGTCFIDIAPIGKTAPGTKSNCEVCGRPFILRRGVRKKHMYCSSACRHVAFRKAKKLGEFKQSSGTP